MLRANRRGESGACDCGGFVARFGISMFNLNLVADAPMFIDDPEELCRGSLTGGCCCLDCTGSWTSSAECCFLGMAEFGLNGAKLSTDEFCATFVVVVVDDEVDDDDVDEFCDGFDFAMKSLC